MDNILLTEKYPNLFTWWFTCQYYVLHNGGNYITLYDQGREVWDSGEITDFDQTLDAAEMWIRQEYDEDSTPIEFNDFKFSQQYPQLTRWFTDPKRSVHNRGEILLNLYDELDLVWHSGEMTDVDAIFEAADAWIKTA